jgi:lipid-A-disaccharide synthase-like uncharacterized protein
MELIGYIGSAFLAINAVPELIRTINDGRCHIGWPMLVLWLLGEIFTTVYAISLGNIPLIMNYVFNLFIVIVMLWYKLRTIYVTDKYIEKDELIITKL